MVLPADSLPPILNGPLLRSSTLADGMGLVISLQGNPVEIVVASEISVRYLQAKTNGEHVFRVSQRFVLRVKDKTAVARIGRLAAKNGEHEMHSADDEDEMHADDDDETSSPDGEDEPPAPEDEASHPDREERRLSFDHKDENASSNSEAMKSVFGSQWLSIPRRA